jgi:ornithine lipid ester-linked acyl 2-hydroxylase
VYKNSQDFEFTARLESNWPIIRQELEQINRRDFISWPEKHLYGKGWDIFGLYAFGMRLGKNCNLCPETTKLVETIPGMVTAGFSSLLPGTHIAAHTGYPDGVLRCHLGMVGCDGCSLRVGDETHNWQEGKCLVFDDTTEHEAWNRGTQTRIVLLLDFKYPHPELVESKSNTEASPSFWQKLFRK